jgi:hypothetical protein
MKIDKNTPSTLGEHQLPHALVVPLQFQVTKVVGEAPPVLRRFDAGSSFDMIIMLLVVMLVVSF